MNKDELYDEIVSGSGKQPYPPLFPKRKMKLGAVLSWILRKKTSDQAVRDEIFKSMRKMGEAFCANDRDRYNAHHERIKELIEHLQILK